MADSDRDQVWRIVLDACRTIPNELQHTFLAHVLASILDSETVPLPVLHHALDLGFRSTEAARRRISTPPRKGAR